MSRPDFGLFDCDTHRTSRTLRAWQSRWSSPGSSRASLRDQQRKILRDNAEKLFSAN
jgi:hypothetical protein